MSPEPRRPPSRTPAAESAEREKVWNGLEPDFVRDAAAERLKALAHHDRLRIVEALARGPRNVSELAAEIGMPNAAVSRHLRVLDEAGAVKGERRGNYVRYSLADRDVIRVALVAYRGAGGRVREQLGARRISF